MKATYDMAELRQRAEERDARMHGAIFGSRHRARDLAELGGACDVHEDYARFDIRLSDGRRLEGCGIHLAGGAVPDTRRALTIARDVLEHGVTVVILLVRQWWGREWIEIPCGDVVELTAHEAAS